jgi:hypothetical protein
MIVFRFFCEILISTNLVIRGDQKRLFDNRGIPRKACWESTLFDTIRTN